MTNDREGPTQISVGMPAFLRLNEFCSHVKDCFGEYPYLVGSSLFGKGWRDVDIRLILEDDHYEALGFGPPSTCHANGRWVALVMAFSALGKEMTGLPIDFQIQQCSDSQRFTGKRHFLGLTATRLRHEWEDQAPDWNTRQEAAK